MVSGWVKLFVLFHLLTLIVWTLPLPPAAVRSGQAKPRGIDRLFDWNERILRPFPPIRLYGDFTGFWQYWDMFAPNPARTDQWCDAEVIYLDGRVKRYAYPRMAALSIWQKFVEERYRKLFERVAKDESSYLWPSFGLRIALINDDLENPPVKIRLFLHWRIVAAPGEPQNPAYATRLFYVYIVDQNELGKLRTPDP